MAELRRCTSRFRAAWRGRHELALLLATKDPPDERGSAESDVLSSAYKLCDFGRPADALLRREALPQALRQHLAKRGEQFSVARFVAGTRAAFEEFLAGKQPTHQG